MTVTLPDLVQPLKWDGADFDSGIDRATKKGLSLGQALGGLAIGAAAIGVAAAAKGMQFIGQQAQLAIADLSEVQDMQAQLNSVLESTGGIAGVTAEQANKLADAFENTTKFSAEQVLTGENLLLTFTNIGKDIFPQATETMLDMSQALGQDMKSSAVQLGKALQDPILGVTALRRVGVNFNEEQTTMVKNMVEAGDVAGAQAFILRELQTEFGGSARAAGETFGGQLEILKNKIGEVRENIFSSLMPSLGDLITRFKDKLISPEFQASLEKFTTWIGDTAVPFITDKLIPALEVFAFETVPEFVAALGEWIGEVSTFFSTAKQDIVAFGEDNKRELSAIQIHWEELISNAGTAWDGFMDLLGTSSSDWNILSKAGTAALQAIDIYIWYVNKSLQMAINLIGMLKSSLSTLSLPGSFAPASPQTGGKRPPAFRGYASGGVVPGPVGSAQMAVVHGGETITPAGGSATTRLSRDDMRELARMLSFELAKAIG